MNNEQRKQLRKAVDIIENVVIEEQERLDNLEEHFSHTEKYQTMEATLEVLEEIKDKFDELE